MSTTEKKRFIPLESNPTVFTDLIHRLGVSKRLAFSDVYSLDDPDLLAIIPRPAYGLVLVFPTTPTYDAQTAETEAKREPYAGSGPDEEVVWYKQTIYNACGLYGILHVISNGDARKLAETGSTIDNLVNKAVPLTPKSRAISLEEDEALEKAHHSAATQGDSRVPELEEEVDYHYVAFIKSAKTGHFFELDGAKKGPIDLGIALEDDEDVLDPKALAVIKGWIARENDENVGFTLLALTPNLDAE